MIRIVAIVGAPEFQENSVARRVDKGFGIRKLRPSWNSGYLVEESGDQMFPAEEEANKLPALPRSVVAGNQE
jgi:hypothetical protein